MYLFSQQLGLIVVYFTAILDSVNGLPWFCLSINPQRCAGFTKSPASRHSLTPINHPIVPQLKNTHISDVSAFFSRDDREEEVERNLESHAISSVPSIHSENSDNESFSSILSHIAEENNSALTVFPRGSSSPDGKICCFELTT